MRKVEDRSVLLLKLIARYGRYIPMYALDTAHLWAKEPGYDPDEDVLDTKTGQIVSRDDMEEEGA